MSNINEQDLARLQENNTLENIKATLKENSTADDVMLWVECPEYQDEVHDAKIEYLEDNNGNMVKHITLCFGSLGSVEDNLYAWSKSITELSKKEVELYKLKEAYEKASEKLLKDAAKEKAENDNDIIKAKYGGNNDKTRAKYVKEMLIKEDREIKNLEFSIDYLKRRISFLKQLIHTKTIIMEVKE